MPLYPPWHGVIMLRVFASPLVTQMEIHPANKSFPAWPNVPGSAWALLSLVVVYVEAHKHGGTGKDFFCLSQGRELLTSI